MFSDLYPILQQCRDLNIRLVVDKQNEANIQVFVTPLHPDSKKNPALNQTVMFTASPEELDRDFASGIADLTPHYVAVANTVTQAIAALAAAKESTTRTVHKTGVNKFEAKDKLGDKAPSKANKQQAISLFDGLDEGIADKPEESETEQDSAAEMLAAQEDERAELDASSAASSEQPMLFPTI